MILVSMDGISIQMAAFLIFVYLLWRCDRSDRPSAGYPPGKISESLMAAERMQQERESAAERGSHGSGPS